MTDRPIPPPPNRPLEPEPYDGDLGAGIPAVFVNRFFARSHPQMCRLTLGEIDAEAMETNWRLAVAMTPQAMESLANLLLEVLQSLRPEQTEGADVRPPPAT